MAPPVAAPEVALPSFPRSQSGAAPQHLLVTLLGDYWLDADAGLPLSALLDTMAEFGVGAVNARAAVNRLCRRGVLVAARNGRSARYGLATGMPDEFAVGIHGVLDFAVHEPVWDGRWTVALFTLTAGAREQRHTVYSGLRALGFGPLHDGSWISPRPVADRTRELFEVLSVRDAVVLRADARPLPAGRSAGDVWDLGEAHRLYSSFLDTHRPTTDSEPEPQRALVRRTRAMDDWRAIPDADPRLPAALRPADWPRAAAFEAFRSVYDDLLVEAAAQFADIVDRRAPGLGSAVRGLTVADLVERGRVAVAGQSPSRAARHG